MCEVSIGGIQRVWGEALVGVIEKRVAAQVILMGGIERTAPHFRGS